MSIMEITEFALEDCRANKVLEDLGPPYLGTVAETRLGLSIGSAE